MRNLFLKIRTQSQSSNIKNSRMEYKQDFKKKKILTFEKNASKNCLEYVEDIVEYNSSWRLVNDKFF